MRITEHFASSVGDQRSASPSSRRGTGARTSTLSQPGPGTEANVHHDGSGNGFVSSGRTPVVIRWICRSRVPQLARLWPKVWVATSGRPSSLCVPMDSELALELLNKGHEFASA